MKRFWKEVSVRREGGNWAIKLDARAVKTPARASLAVPSRRLAEAIADEWRSVGETLDPRAMPMTGLANAAIDRVAPAPKAFADGLARYAETDLACYRAEGPARLRELQDKEWDRLLDWARRRFDVDFARTTGLMHVAQPEETVRRLRHAIETVESYRLAGLSPLVTIGGSLIAALALLENAITAEQAWEAVSLDERWQLEQWGADAEAQAVLQSRRGEFLAAARFLDLLD